MNTTETKRATSLRLNKGLYSRIEKEAKKENRSINNFLETLIREALDYHEPNEETIQAIEEARREKPFLKRYDNTEELLKDLMAD